jgi:predicted TPR repeat methyltransferase
LEEILAAAYRCLEPASWFVFSLEELLPDPSATIPSDGAWTLQFQGRYAHSMQYVRAVARDAGFVVRTLERQTLRFELDAPVPGLLCVLERPHGC